MMSDTMTKTKYLYRLYSNDYHQKNLNEIYDCQRYRWADKRDSGNEPNNEPHVVARKVSAIIFHQEVVIFLDNWVTFGERV